MKLNKSASLTLIVLCSSIALLSQDLPKVKQPEEAGFSSQRLKLAGNVLQADVDNKNIPGAVLLIARGGKVAYLHEVGYQNRAKNEPMKSDSIFRIASMTKPVTSVAVMMLAEEGKIDLGSPVARYLPEFKDVKVGVEKPAAAGGKPDLVLEPPLRPMTVQDLLRHTSGLTYGFFGNSEVDQLYRKSNLFDPNQTLADFVTRLSKLPLAHQPGTVWEYSLSTDVLSRLVEVVSGIEFDRFIAERITKPLHMPDTAFYLSEAESLRLAVQDGAQPPAVASATTRPNFISGGGGLFSTAMDYARFSQMLLNQGELDGVRLLSPKSVALMTANALPPAVSRHSPVAMVLGAIGPTPEMGRSFGLGFAIRTDPGLSPLPGSVGEYYWVGIYGTSFWVDPQEKLFAVFMVQLPQEKTNHYISLTRTLVYQALVK